MNNALHLQEVVLKQTADGFLFFFKVAAFSQGMPLVRQGKDQSYFLYPKITLYIVGYIKSELFSLRFLVFFSPSDRWQFLTERRTFTEHLLRSSTDYVQMLGRVCLSTTEAMTAFSEKGKRNLGSFYARVLFAL